MGYDGHVIFDALYLRRKGRCNFGALAQTSLNIYAYISQVIEVSIHKFTNENIFPEAIQKTVLPHNVGQDRRAPYQFVFVNVIIRIFDPL